jgi:AcrR family transcriptional regulator
LKGRIPLDPPLKKGEGRRSIGKGEGNKGIGGGSKGEKKVLDKYLDLLQNRPTSQYVKYFGGIMTQRKSKEIRRQEILNAALTCFSRKGYHDTKMDDIIKTSGLSKGALYWHFKGKRDIFIALIEQHIEEDKVLIRRLTDEREITRSLLKHAGLVFLERHFKKEKKELIPLFVEFVAESSRDREIEEKLKAIYGEWIDLIRRLFDRAKKKGIIRDIDSECLARGVCALIDGLIELHIVFGGKLKYRKVWDTCADALMEGIARGGHE